MDIEDIKKNGEWISALSLINDGADVELTLKVPADKYNKDLLRSIDQVIAEAKKAEESGIPIFSDYRKSKNENIEYLTEEENTEVNNWVSVCENEHNGDLMDEGFLGKLFGGTAGFIIGPTVGKIIARALGIEKGVMYDMLTSRLVSTALGIAIADSFGGKYKDKKE